jgi:hypothetical protein
VCENKGKADGAKIECGSDPLHRDNGVNKLGEPVCWIKWHIFTCYSGQLAFFISVCEVGFCYKYVTL